MNSQIIDGTTTQASKSALRKSIAGIALLGGALALSACGDRMHSDASMKSDRTAASRTVNASPGQGPAGAGMTQTTTGPVRYADGSIRHTDGTVYYSDGMALYPDGSIRAVRTMPGQAPNPAPGQGPARQAGNTAYTPKGDAMRYESVRYADGTIVHPDGTIYYSDGRVRYADGTIQNLEQAPGSANQAPGQGPAGKTEGRVRG